jgi:hypothetical protein
MMMGSWGGRPGGLRTGSGIISLTPCRILRMPDMLYHGEVAEAENLALTALGSIVHGSACRVSATAGSILQLTPDATVIPVCTSSSQAPVALG